MKNLFYATLLLFTSSAFASEQLPPKPLIDCLSEVPYGAPVSLPGTVTNCRTGYLVNIDLEAKIPYWTAHTLIPRDAVSCLPREDAFAPDLSLPKGKRAELADYRKSGYDQGHMVSNADLSFNETAQRESFLLSNMSPQLPGLNRGIWKQLETATRAWTYTLDTNITVYAGNIWNENSKTIGESKVKVPDYLYKIIIFNKTNQTIAFLFPNREALGSNLPSFQVNVAKLEQLTNITFNIPDSKLLVNSIPAVDSKRVTEDKRNLCK